MKFGRFEPAQLPEFAGWFADATEIRTWGGPDFRFPFTPSTFLADAHYMVADRMLP